MSEEDDIAEEDNGNGSVPPNGNDDNGNGYDNGNNNGNNNNGNSHGYRDNLKGKHSREEVNSRIAHIYELIAVGYTDREIMSKLGMHESTYYQYKQRLYKRYGNYQRAKTEDAIYTQQALLAERLTRLFRMCELKLRNDINNMSGVEVSALGSFAQELAINVLKLECEGLRATTRGLNTIVREKTNRYLTVSGPELENNTIPDTTTRLQ